MISTATNTVTATITGLIVPYGIAISPNGANAYVANSGGASVSVISTAANKVTNTITGISSPFGVAVAPNGAYAYVTNYGGNTVSVINTVTNTMTSTVTVGSSPTGVALTLNGAYAYITNNGASSVSVISTGTPVVNVSPSSYTMPGQSTIFTATASGGSGTYTSYQWYFDGVAQNGQTASTYIYQISGNTGLYSVAATVTDSLGATSAQSYLVLVRIDSALVAPTIASSLGTVDQGKTCSLTSSSMTTGASPYANQWFDEAPGASSYSAVSGATSASYSFVTSGSTTTGAWSFDLQVNDSASVPGVVTSLATSVTVNAAPSVTVSPGTGTMDIGQSQLFTASPSGGSGSYTSYQWYVDGSAQSGQTASTFNYSPASVGSHTIIVTVTDSLGATSSQSVAATVTASTVVTPNPTPTPTSNPTPTPKLTPVATATVTPTAKPRTTTTPSATASSFVFNSVDLSITIIVAIAAVFLVLLSLFRRRNRKAKKT